MKTEDTLRTRYLTLMRQDLPRRAAEENWVIRFDHCFMRVVLDNMFGGRWYEHISGRPAYKHLSIEQLKEAIAAAEAILEQGPPLLNRLNAQSLAWRRAATRQVPAPPDNTEPLFPEPEG
ncbi:MAG: hypothetical protein AAFV53_12515 [Myxococcota bacterium]